MPIVLQINTPELCVWKMDESPEELAALLDDASLYEGELQGFRSEARRKEKLTTYVLLNKMLGHDAILLHKESSAPYLPNESHEISISHTKGFAAVALSSGKGRVAVDIEYRSDRVYGIRHRFLSSEEVAFIDPMNEVSHLLICWCAKETLYKVIDLPEVDFIRHLHIRPFPYAAKGEIEVYETRTETEQSFRLKFQVHDQYTIVWFGE